MAATRRSFMRVSLALFFVGVIVVEISTSGSAPQSRRATSPSQAASSWAPSGNPLLIGLQAPLSGPESVEGQDMLRGAQLEVAALNSGGGLLGRPIGLAVTDDASSSKVAMHAANELIDRRVVGVVGPLDADAAKSALPIYDRAGVPVVSLASSGVAPSNASEVVATPVDTQIVVTEAQEIAEVLHASSVVEVYNSAAAGDAKRAGELAAILRATGVSVAPLIADPPGTPTGDVVSQLRSDKADVWYLALDPARSGSLVQATEGAGVGGRCIVDLAGPQSAFAASAGPSAAACIASGLPAAGDLPAASGYVNSYSAIEPGAVPGPWGAFAYDAVGLLAKVISESRSASREVIGSHLRSSGPYQGITGPLSFDPKDGRRLQPPLFIYSISASGSYGVDEAWAAFSGYQPS